MQTKQITAVKTEGFKVPLHVCLHALLTLGSISCQSVIGITFAPRTTKRNVFLYVRICRI